MVLLTRAMKYSNNIIKEVGNKEGNYAAKNKYWQKESGSKMKLPVISDP